MRVVCDLDTLATLPRARTAAPAWPRSSSTARSPTWRSSTGSRRNIDALLARDPAALAHAVRRSCEIKAWVVGQDEREAGLRAILNFGHTFGHAIEAGLGYGKWLHGEAVGCGMVMAAHLSQRLGLVDAAFVQRAARA